LGFQYRYLGDFKFSTFVLSGLLYGFFFLKLDRKRLCCCCIVYLRNSIITLLWNLSRFFVIKGSFELFPIHKCNYTVRLNIIYQEQIVDKYFIVFGTFLYAKFLNQFLDFLNEFKDVGRHWVVAVRSSTTTSPLDPLGLGD